jgi:hypothetical protein
MEIIISEVCRNASVKHEYSILNWNTAMSLHWHLIYRVSREECKKLQECVPYVKIYQYNPKHLYPKLNGYGDNGQRSLKL